MPTPFDLALLHLPENSEVQELLRLCPDAAPLRYGDGELLVAPGDAGQDIFLLLRGGCLVEHADAPEERTHGHELAIVEGSPDMPVFVGEMAYLGGGRRTAVVRSALNSFVLRLKPAHIDRIIERLPNFTRTLCRQFCKRLGEADELLRREHARAAMNCRTLSLQTDEILFESGQESRELYQLVFGALSEEVTGGAPREITCAGEPVFVGAREYFTAMPRRSTVRAKGNCMLVGIDAASRRAAVRNFPELVLGLLADG